MVIVDSKVNVVFGEIDGIVKKFYNNSDFLGELFDEAELIPVPEDAPCEIPRFVLKSKGGHSTLSLSKNMSELYTKYDGEYNSQWELCEENLLQKIDAIYKTLDDITEGKYLFSGITVTVIDDRRDEDGTNKLENAILRINSQIDLYDIDCKLTYVQDGQYINIRLSNMRIGDFSIEEDKLIPGMLKDITSNAITVNIDVNDRYEFNMDEKFVSTQSNMKKNVQKVGRVLTGIPDLIEKGEIDL